MARIIKLKIDVSKISKDRLFKGAKGTYLDATLFLEEEPDEYGQNGMITQDVSKEEREAGTKGAILGNAKILQGRGQQQQRREQTGTGGGSWQNSQPGGRRGQGAQTQNWDDKEELPF